MKADMPSDKQGGKRHDATGSSAGRHSAKDNSGG